MNTIDNIPWNKLSHAYSGDASDLGTWLQALFVANNDETFEAALSRIDFVIWHQGAVYSATPHTVPFLIGVLPKCPITSRAQLINLLARIADGKAPHVQNEFLSSEIKYGYMDPIEYDERMKEQLTWVKNCQIEVWKGFELYLSLLNDEVTAVRIEVPNLLATLLTQDKSHRPESLRHIDLDERVSKIIKICLSGKQDPFVACSFVFGLSSIGTRHTANLSYLKELMRFTGKERLRICAAICLIDHQRYDAALDVIIDALSRHHETDKLFNSELPWFAGWLRFQLIARLCTLPPKYIDLVLPALLTSIDTATHWTVDSDVAAILSFAFQGKKVDINKGASTLTDSQRIILQRIYDNKEIWDPKSGNVSFVFHKIGLEKDRQQWNEFLMH
jgi:hypothetical protein